jgi:monofunctional biosynthetic peptidoglycan transglycosylase
MKKITLITLLICLVLIVGLTGFAFKLFYANDVEKLVHNYPYFDQDSKSYQLTHLRPKSWIDINSISKEAKWAIVVSEDWAFYDHNGLDLEQLKIAIAESIKQEKFVRGASTITQQVIKNTLLTSEKSLWRKFREAILSIKVEKLLSKDKILEIYLNIVELGDNIYGIGEASMHYFNKSPSLLSAREGAFLAMLLPSPVKYSISFKKKELTPFAKSVVDSILIKLRQAKVYDHDQWLINKEEKFSWEKRIDEMEKFEADYGDDEYLEYNIYE